MISRTGRGAAGPASWPFRNSARWPGRSAATSQLTVDQFTEGARCFRELVDVLGETVRHEWLQAIETIEKQAEEWSAEAGWRTRRVNKKISESLIGTYELPQLLIFAEPNLYVLDPVARFIPGGKDPLISRFSPRTTRLPCIETTSGAGTSTWRFAMGSRRGRRVEWSNECSANASSS